MTDKQLIDKLVKQTSQINQHQSSKNIDLSKLHVKKETTKETLDQDWLDLVEDWQQQPFTKVDINQLTQQTARRIFKTKLIFTTDLIATIVIIISFFHVWLFSSEDKSTVIYIGFAALTTPIYMYISYKMRIASWKIGVGTPTSAISAAIEACYSSIQFLQLLKYSVFALFIPINWYVYALKTAQNKPMLFGFILVNSILLLMYAISYRMQQKRKNELANLKKLK